MGQKLHKLRKFLSYYAPYRGLMVAVLFCAALVGALSLIFPILVRYITKDLLESGTANVSSTILQTGALMTVVIILHAGFSMFYDYKGHDMGAKIERDMRQELFSHYQTLPFSFFDHQKTGQLMSRLTSDLLNLAELYHHGPENLVIYGSQFIGALVILLRINLKLTLVVCAFLPVIAICSAIFYSRLQKSYRANRERIADVNAQAEENLSGIRTVKSFANEALEREKFSVENNRFYQSRSDIYRNEALQYTVIEKLLMQLLTASIVVFGGMWVAGETLALADLLIFVMYAAYLTGPIPKLSFMVQQYQEGLSGYRRFREMIDTVPDIKDAENAIDLQITKGQVTFDNVSFRYSEDQEYVLQNIDLDVSPGETVAIVGLSGIGKTTLGALIPRFYEACGGAIRIDGIDVRNVKLHSLRQQIGIVRQDNFLFAGTVLDNILYGKPGATADEAVKAAKKANAHGFIMALPNGYDTDIGQRGVRLSGGQQQRISIARVFLKDPAILILDEATSALDYESEKVVMESIRTLAQGRTTFIIAHRLSTVQSANRIVVLGDNGIAEEGTHEQLCALNAVYANLYHSQTA